MPAGLQHIHGARRRRFGIGIERDARPKTPVEHELHGVFLDVIDDDALRLHPAVRGEQIENQPRALEFVLEVGRVDEDQLVVFHREIDVVFEDLELVARVAVEPDFTDAEHVGLGQKFRDHRQHIGREREVFGFLRVDAEPGKMRQEKLRRARRLVVGQLAEVIAKSIRRAAVKSRPKRRLADRRTSGRDHRLIIVGRAADHVAVRFDVAHGTAD